MNNYGTALLIKSHTNKLMNEICLSLSEIEVADTKGEHWDEID